MHSTADSIAIPAPRLIWPQRWAVTGRGETPCRVASVIGKGDITPAIRARRSGLQADHGLCLWSTARSCTGDREGQGVGTATAPRPDLMRSVRLPGPCGSDSVAMDVLHRQRSRTEVRMRSIDI